MLLALLLALRAHAMDTTDFRREYQDIIDERESSAVRSYKEAVIPFERARKNLIGVGKIGVSQNWAKDCVGLKPFWKEIGDVYGPAASSPSVETILPVSRAGVLKGYFTKEDLETVDPCTGAVNAEKGAVSKGVAELAASSKRFQTTYKALHDAATRLGGDIFLKKVPDNAPACRDLRRKIFRSAVYFYMSYDDLARQFQLGQDDLRQEAQALKKVNCGM